MKNKLLIAGLSLTLALAPSVLAEASDSSEITMTTTNEKKISSIAIILWK